MVDELFSKRLPITIKCTDREDRKVNIQVTVEMHTAATPVHRKELVIRLTDGSDLFFLYTLQLTEEDFQSLKAQQGLLVDFGAFPQKFVDLLHLVLQEEHKETPKFILDFVCTGGNLGTSTGVLNVIETNPFKHLVHLALKFIPGTDTDIKKYLAGCLKALQDQNQTLLHKFSHTESDLSSQLKQAQDALAARTAELDSLKTEWAAKVIELTAKSSQEMTASKDQMLQNQTAIQQRYEREKHEVEQNHAHSMSQMNARLRELESSNKDLTDRKYKSESTIRELRSKLTLLEEEHLRAKQELQSLRKNNAGLDADYHEQDKLLNQLKTRLAVLEQEVKDKEELVKKTTDLLKTEQEQKKMQEEQIDQKHRKTGKLEMTIKTMSEEITKGNEIIRKLQAKKKKVPTATLR